MGKRQIRVFKRDIVANLENLRQKDAHVVMRSGQVLRGIIKEFTAEVLTLHNHRQHSHNVELTEIEEIVFDRETKF